MLNFVNQLDVKFEEGTCKSIRRFVCKGENGIPCGNVLHKYAGQFEEIVIGLVGSAKAGKSTYLGSLLASIRREEKRIKYFGHKQDNIISLARCPGRDLEDLIYHYINCEKFLNHVIIIPLKQQKR